MNNGVDSDKDDVNDGIFTTKVAPEPSCVVVPCCPMSIAI